MHLPRPKASGRCGGRWGGALPRGVRIENLFLSIAAIQVSSESGRSARAQPQTKVPLPLRRSPLLRAHFRSLSPQRVPARPPNGCGGPATLRSAEFQEQRRLPGSDALSAGGAGGPLVQGLSSAGEAAHVYIGPRRWLHRGAQAVGRGVAAAVAGAVGCTAGTAVGVIREAVVRVGGSGSVVGRAVGL